MGGASLELNGVARRYGRAEDAPGLQDINLDIELGTFAAITGPSGSGKTTLLNLVAGLDRADAGTVRVNGRDLNAMSARDLADFRLRQVGVIFQAYHLIPELSVFSNVELPALLAGVPRREARERAAELLERVGIAAGADRRPHELSGGERQRAAVARAMINRPPLIVADEPTGNLDTGSGAVVLDLIGQAHLAGATVLLVTHDQAIAARAHRQVRLLDGRIT